MPLFAQVADAAPNPALGMFLFTLGGLTGAVFYLPFRKVKNWAWESYWLVWALFALLIFPWALTLSTSPNVVSVLLAAPGKVIAYCFVCGLMWGFGGLTWGLMMRYLGFGLGLAIGGGLCSATGTLMPPVLKPVLERLLLVAPANTTFADAVDEGVRSLYATTSAKVALLGIVVSLVSILLVGAAGISKEREVSEEEKRKSIAEFDLKKGILVAIFCGLMSAGMSFGLQGGAAIERLALETKPLTSPTWKGLPVLVVVLFGGFIVNSLWCLFLNLKNKTTGDYFESNAPLIGNLFFAGLAGMLWSSGLVCFKTGSPAMGKLGYIGWSATFAASILFGTIVSIILGEWRGTSLRTRWLLFLGLLLLVSSAVISTYSGYLKQ
jgi:L-rhamnose-H+ transport protein